MARQRRIIDLRAGELNLTAMIDVAFQLLAFFLIAVHPVPLLTNIPIYRPMEVPKTQEITPVTPLSMIIDRDGYILQGQRVDTGQMDHRLTLIARSDPETPVAIKCTPDSTHEALVTLLDCCARAKLKKLLIFSL